jgi:type II secretory pathway pseudopilin PulG
MSSPPVRRSARLPAAFTLVEALVSIAITAIAASVLLLGIQSSLQTTDEALHETVATGLARQLLDEILGARYHAVGFDGYQVVFGPSTDETSGSGRERYDDIDDFDGLRIQPAEDLWGVALGTDDGEGGQRHPGFWAPADVLDRWRQEVDVYYVDPSDLTTPLPSGQVSDYRVVEVRIVLVDPARGDRELARLRRVVAYVPPIP